GKGKREEEEEEGERDRMETIAAGGRLLQGEVRPTGSWLPGFVPTGSDTAMTPLATGDLVLWRNLPPDGDYSRAPAILNTRSNEALPVSVDQFDAERIRFHWEPSEVREVATSEIYAVQFPEPAMKLAQGFEAGGWRILGRSKTAVKKSKEGVVLQPDTGIGHPFLLHGEDFGFSFKKEQHNASFRVRLFCQGTKRSSDSVNFLIAHYSNSVYAGIERGEDGQFSSNQSIQVGSNDDPVHLDFKFEGDSVELHVNGVAVGKSKRQRNGGQKRGRGLIIETTSIWGNSFGPMQVLDFSMQGSPIGVAAPSFDDGAKREALLLPRLRRDVPPRHILIGRNGDLLRGEIGAKSGTDVLFRVGLEEYKVPIERVAAAVWVEEADKVMDDVKKPPAAAAVEEAPEPQAASREVLEDYSTQYLDLSNGGLLKLEVESWGADGVIGDHEILGRCNIPPSLVHRVSLSPPRPSSAMISLSGWKFEHTVDPLPPGQEEADVSPLVGKPAPDFTLDMLDGEAFELSKAKGRVVVLDFWATWCAPCVRSLPHVIEAMAGFPADKVSFVAVNQGEAPKQVKQFMEIRGFEMPVGFDPEMKTGEQFGVESIPFTVVIDPAGTVTYVSLGASPDGARKLADAVTKALSAGEIE
ncbi:MAG: TlpA family protein disulfide reductase, partial [Verrucomicrobiales bacterium]